MAWTRSAKCINVIKKHMLLLPQMSGTCKGNLDHQKMFKQTWKWEENTRFEQGDGIFWNNG
ncbi:hypothetical protein D8674_028815 [Pyrus ussuriensis x Pyrus communis]|uniref:Uncharacterized protein n=1 Tax=Pyrus ussuriensis x Pyrus communis TaxID=2448454 RepID=A0A5N5HXD5_9ROSA|nr:hypothetical protein D8674_028813 [Pyrus ussuriensis x Pyrus communis]KAB2632568.1 hypothetical protein D8674_028815 [Pyrus ussuriensis x Pyrus communis]